MSNDNVVIVGGGLAGAKVAEGLRADGFTGSVTIVAAELEAPYERPPLSKEYLKGGDFDDTLVNPRGWYAEHDVDLRLGAEAVAIHRAESELELADSTRLSYDVLVLATGSEPAHLSVPGAEAGLHLRTRADSDAIRSTFGEGKRLVVVGGGWVGLEVAAAAREAGTDVTVVIPGELPLLRVLGREMATVFADLHREHGVDLRTGATVVEIRTDGDRAVGVRLEDGTELDADAVVVGVGARPRVSLADTALLEVDGGVLVDATLRTSDPKIFAIGDIADEDHPVLGRRVRVEHWANAQNQGTFVASIINGGDGVYDRLPYFYSDQYDLGMEYVGQATAGSYARVIVRGDLAGREFVAFWLDDADHVLAGMNVNVWDVVDDIKPLITGRVVVDVDRLADPNVPISELS